jgi:hypothetical protein
MSARRSRRDGARGQALVELGIGIVLLVTLTAGIIELGRAFMVANVITHAVRDGGRVASVVPASARNAQGIINDPTPIQNRVRSDIQSVVDPSGLRIDVDQPTVAGIPLVRVQVNGTVPYIFNLLGSDGLTVARSVTLRDEGR